MKGLLWYQLDSGIRQNDSQKMEAISGLEAVVLSEGEEGKAIQTDGQDLREENWRGPD